jgi:hypothetical protein
MICLPGKEGRYDLHQIGFATRLLDAKFFERVHPDDRLSDGCVYA